MTLLWALIPESFRKYIYGALIFGVLALTIWYQSARIDSLKVQRDLARADAAHISAAYDATTKALRHAYDVANEVTAKYHEAQNKAAATVTVYKEKIVHVYEKNPEVRALLDMPLPADLLDGMCQPFPGSCYLPAPPETPAGADGSALPAASVAAPPVIVRDMVDNRAELLAWAEDARARHAALVEFLNKAGD